MINKKHTKPSHLLTTKAEATKLESLIILGPDRNNNFSLNYINYENPI